MVLSSGTVISGYRIGKVLGAGGMGTVYLADNPVLPRQDALKVLSAELSADPAFRTRFQREADVASALDHPNIVTVYSRGETETGQLWIAMQYVAGSDAERETDAGRMTPARAVRITAAIADALDYAHRRGGLVHRDVKPANFLLADPGDAGGEERILLADFGIARALDDAVGLTGTGNLVMTVAYAAPEMLAGGGQVDGRADIYSLGCSLYRMLTGKAPFAGAVGIPAMMAAHLYAPPPRVTELRPDLSAALDAVIATALAKDPDQRYGTARELAAAAAAALDAAGGGTAEWVAPPADALAAAAPPVITYPSGSFSGPTADAPTPRLPAGQSGAAVPHPSASSPLGRRVGRRPVVLTAVVALLAALTGGALWFTNRTEPYQERTVTHSHGGTRLTARPTAVAALGPSDADAVLSLGVQPVAVMAADGVLPDYLQRLITGNVKTLASLNATAIAIARPDLIIDTGAVDQTQYNALSAITATITRPEGAAWTWQDQLAWIGDQLGRADTARDVLAAAGERQQQVRTAHPAFDSKSVVVVTVADDGVTVTPASSRAADYLQGLGMRYSDAVPAAPAGQATAPVDPASLNATPTAVRIVVRTDRAAAGGGNYNGLPRPFTEYKGATVIVDDPDVITALDTGGAAATELLDSALVDAISEMVH